MAASPRFGLFKQRLAELRSHFLPAILPAATGTYSVQEIDHARAYRLLVHAEIEAFLEERATETIRIAMTEWQGTKKLSQPLLGVLAYAKSASAKMEAIPPRAVKTDLEERLSTAIGAHAGAVKENNGIRSKNLAALLLGVGIQETDLDTLWVTNMDNFGQQRGDVAHRSTHGLLATPTVNPADELALVERELLPGIEKVDLLLNAFVGK